MSALPHFLSIVSTKKNTYTAFPGLVQPLSSCKCKLKETGTAVVLITQSCFPVNILKLFFISLLDVLCLISCFRPLWSLQSYLVCWTHFCVCQRTISSNGYVNMYRFFIPEVGDKTIIRKLCTFLSCKNIILLTQIFRITLFHGTVIAEMDVTPWSCGIFSDMAVRREVYSIDGRVHAASFGLSEFAMRVCYTCRHVFLLWGQLLCCMIY
jgi:hypothetical protein